MVAARYSPYATGQLSIIISSTGGFLFGVSKLASVVHVHKIIPLGGVLLFIYGARQGTMRSLQSKGPL